MTILDDLRVYHRFNIYLSSIHLQKIALNVHLAHLKWRLGNQNIMNTENNFNFSSSVLSQEQALLEAAIDKVQQPLANLLLAKGLGIQALEEQMRTAFVQSAVALLGSQQPQRMNSRISASTGLMRREVARIQAQSEVPAELHSKIRPTSAPELFTHRVTFSNGPVQIGDIARAKGVLINGQLIAKDVDLVAQAKPVELSGLVTNVNFAACDPTFQIGDVVVHFDLETLYVNGMITDLINGVELDVQGISEPFNSDVRAKQITFLP
jgi:hypothetical protein